MAKRKKIELNEMQIQWLRNAVEEKISTSDMALEIGCCTDTIHRLLDRYNIVEALQEKHMTPSPKMWNRPCMKCGSTISRPYMQYICTKCKIDAKPEVDGLADDFLIY